MPDALTATKLLFKRLVLIACYPLIVVSEWIDRVTLADAHREWTRAWRRIAPCRLCGQPVAKDAQCTYGSDGRAYHSDCVEFGEVDDAE